MKKTDEIVIGFYNEIKKYGFIEISSDDYMVRYTRENVEIQLFFGRYSEQPDIFVRYEDDDKPEQFSVALMLFTHEMESGLENSLNDSNENTRMIKIVDYFIKNSDTVLSKAKCRSKKAKLDEYLKSNY
ncbi:hypothetical protein [Vallitalea guaymasensis]|uniref:hypothetical protein n=1 Tax=Vallitalea guaymasensis TaxID=1185412 RepID=UPI002352DC16|nr:hypothetical protein [Vallitalea guaymasensis]